MLERANTMLMAVIANLKALKLLAVVANNVLVVATTQKSKKNKKGELNSPFFHFPKIGC